MGQGGLHLAGVVHQRMLRRIIVLIHAADSIHSSCGKHNLHEIEVVCKEKRLAYNLWSFPSAEDAGQHPSRRRIFKVVTKDILVKLARQHKVKQHICIMSFNIAILGTCLHACLLGLVYFCFCHAVRQVGTKSRYPSKLYTTM